MKSRNAAVASLLTVDEVADFLRASPAMIYRLLKRGEIPGFKIGGDWRFDVEEIDRWRAEWESRTHRFSTRTLAGRLGQHRRLRHSSEQGARWPAFAASFQHLTGPVIRFEKKEECDWDCQR